MQMQTRLLDLRSGLQALRQEVDQALEEAHAVEDAAARNRTLRTPPRHERLRRDAAVTTLDAPGKTLEKTLGKKGVLRKPRRPTAERRSLPGTG